MVGSRPGPSSGVVALSANRTRRIALKAIAKLLLGVTLVTVPALSAQAGSAGIFQGAAAAARALGQTNSATDTER